MDDISERGRGAESGAIAVTLALILPVLIGILGLVLDGGFLFDVKNKMQSAADTAAIGAAVEARRGGSLSAVMEAARHAAAENAFPNGVAGTTVEVFVPPVSGRYAGRKGYAEVSISQPHAPFLPIYGNAPTTVHARAVAGLADTDVCLLALEQVNPKKKKRAESAADSAKNTLVVDKGAALDMGTGCSVIVNSSAGDALRIDGSITAGRIALAGATWSHGGSLTPAPEVKVPPTADPFATLPVPSTLGSSQRYEKAKGETVTMSAGIYADDVKIEKDSVVTMNPGTYVFRKKFEIDKATVTGTGVTIYMAPGSEFKSKDATLDLSAPVDGTYEAILFFQDRENGKSITFDGDDGELNLEGVIYAKDALVKFGKKSVGRSRYTVIVSAAMKFAKKCTIQSDFGGLANGSPIKQIALAE